MKRALASFENAEAPARNQRVNLFGDARSTEVDRLVLTDADRLRPLNEEIADADAAARQYVAGGRVDAARQLRSEADLLRRYLT